jgi:hypothetical protein
MELPDDVLALVREYSRPCFKYLKEYNHAMHVLHMTSWKKLKEGLHADPERVLPALLKYQDAFIKKNEVYALKDALKQENTMTETERWYAANALHNRLFYAKRSEEELYWTLIRILHGNKNIWGINRDIGR